ncbi:DUF1002 domain-containing protein [Anaerobacillus sp. HL2]|nr:DUF1002 domain-containing protein [Anaerobacillus sp. HL2]
MDNGSGINATTNNIDWVSEGIRQCSSNIGVTDADIYVTAP